MGRRKLHGDPTRDALLTAAEALVAQGGIDAVSVRGAAAGAGTTTRAVYVLFGSKEGLLEALARRTFELLMDAIAAVPPSSDPGRDLINRSVGGFRAFALKHPDLFLLFFTAQVSRRALGSDAEASGTVAYAQLAELIERAKQAGMLGRHSVEEATLLWDALCTGLALRELCGPIGSTDGERIWTEALEAFLIGLGRDRDAAVDSRSGAGPTYDR